MEEILKLNDYNFSNKYNKLFDDKEVLNKLKRVMMVPLPLPPPPPPLPPPPPRL
jgi:hypothetical protein